MGIFIHLSITKTVTKKEWESVYEESVKMMKAFPFCEMRNKKFFGQDLICIVPTEERMYCGKFGWRTTGDYITLKGAEDYFLPKELTNNEIDSDIEDALMGMAPSCTCIEWGDDRTEKCINLWRDKTQGEPYHMYLLAVACMIEDRLGKKAVVYGDITRGQCRKAVKIANEILDKPIGLPVRCDLERFYERLRKLPLKTEEVLNFFERAYLGVQDQEFGEFVRDKFTGEEIECFWKEEFEDSDMKTIGFAEIFREYLNQGFSLEKLCQYVKFVDEEGKEYYDYFVKKVMETEMYIPEKDCKDYVDIDQDAEMPYGIGSLMAQFTLAGAHNPRVKRYMSLEIITAILEECIGDKCDVKKLISEYLAKEKGEDQDNSIILKKIMEIAQEKEESKKEEYTINKYKELLYYEAEDVICPTLQESLLDSYRFYINLTQEEYFAELMQKGYEDRCIFLINNNRELLMKIEEWEKIFTDIQNNKEAFRRYYPMVRVKVDSDGLKNLTRAIVLNDELYKYCEENINPVE